MQVWTNAQFSGDDLEYLREKLPQSLTLAVSASRTRTVLETAPADASIYEAEILFGQPDPGVLSTLPELRWIHLTSAGYTRYDDPQLFEFFRSRSIRLTNSSSVFDQPCAEHVLAMILSFSRRLPWALHDQFNARSWNYAPVRQNSQLLGKQSVFVVGFGAIARRLVQLLQPFGTRIYGYRRNPSTEPGVTMISEGQIMSTLGLVDHVVNILPESNATRSWFGVDQFNAMKRGSYFYNIGRGATVDQAALDESLRSGKLSGAYLDVVTPEPLQADHELWSLPNCFITPHTAGGHLGEDRSLIEHFLRNVERYVSGNDLLDRLV
jgi:phosphoglycerate dehydrogenase-like enzyme